MSPLLKNFHNKSKRATTTPSDSGEPGTAAAAIPGAGAAASAAAPAPAASTPTLAGAASKAAARPSAKPAAPVQSRAGRGQAKLAVGSEQQALAAIKAMLEDDFSQPIEHDGTPSELLDAVAELQARLRGLFGDEATPEMLVAKMQSFGEGCLASLQQGLAAITAGDLTVTVKPDTRMIVVEQGEQGVLVDNFNSVLTSAEATIESFNQLQAHMRELLGDDSCLRDIDERLKSLQGNCLSDLKHGLDAMNDGNLTVTIEPVTQQIVAKPGRTLGAVAETFNSMLATAQSSVRSYDEMRDYLSDMVQEISHNSETLAGASTQMASTSHETGQALNEIADAVNSVAEGADHQVRSVQEAVRITEQLAESSAASAQTAEETATAAAETRELAQKGVAAAESAASSMEAVRDSSATVSEVMESLSQRSDRIGGIVGTITEIAQQTNLLALNAAIEAARAGEHGRGFAVVADEVRKLSEQSKQAAESIESLIAEMQNETTKAVTVFEQSADQTREGAETVERARDAFVQIGASTEQMSARVAEIAAAIREIAASGNLLRDSMNEVSSVAEQSSAATEEVSASTQQSTASTQEVAASAQQLAATAQQLDALIGKFTVA